MKKMNKLVLALLLILMVTACGKAEKYTAGTYTGESKGFGGTVKVTVTTDAEKIVEITAEGAQETSHIGGASLEKLCNRAMEAQSAEIDAVSGATVTSDAFKLALETALSQASK